MQESIKPQALWIVEKQSANLQQASLGNGVLVRTLYSGISRGTEKIVLNGEVPESEYQRMRCHGQEGEFSFPVKYGYCSVGEVLEGSLAGQQVFVLHPHQDYFRIPEERLHLLPETVPASRAILAANMETALNINWDAELVKGERVAVIGAGVVGSLSAYLAKDQGADAVLIDKNAQRASVAAELGIEFLTPEAVSGEFEKIIHTSASEAGLTLALNLAKEEGRIIEASWYGNKTVELPLGGAFHSRRLRIISSQVGKIPASKANWSISSRMQRAIELLEDSRLDCLISGETGFEEIPTSYLEIINHPDTLCHRIRYQ